MLANSNRDSFISIKNKFDSPRTDFQQQLQSITNQVEKLQEQMTQKKKVKLNHHNHGETKVKSHRTLKCDGKNDATALRKKINKLNREIEQKQVKINAEINALMRLQALKSSRITQLNAVDTDNQVSTSNMQPF